MKFGIIGLGRFGFQLAITLAELGCEVLAIDRNEEIVESIKEQVTQSICMNVIDEESLTEIGISELDVVIVATGESFAQSVLLTTILKKNLNVPYVVARAMNDINEKILKLVGADRVFVIERDMGVKIAYTLSLPLADVVPVTHDFAVTTIVAPFQFVGKQVGEVNAAKHPRIACIGVQKGDEIVLVGDTYIILETDKLVFAGNKRYLSSLLRG
ncbi:TrkA family potassium uptake protein [Candidatus Dependentiae bacterium]|nr:TrkA family potassium uptake protein [Candidatus Dependentiae bacterium]